MLSMSESASTSWTVAAAGLGGAEVHSSNAGSSSRFHIATLLLASGWSRELQLGAKVRLKNEATPRSRRPSRSAPSSKQQRRRRHVLRDGHECPRRYVLASLKESSVSLARSRCVQRSTKVIR